MSAGYLPQLAPITANTHSWVGNLHIYKLKFLKAAGDVSREWTWCVAFCTDGFPRAKIFRVVTQIGGRHRVNIQRRFL